MSGLTLGFYGCSSSSSSGNAPGTDAGNGTDAHVTTDGSSPGNDAGPGVDGSSTVTTQLVTETALVADTSAGNASHIDPNLVNPWGIAFGPTGIAWVADNGTGVLSLYDSTGTAEALVVTVPPPVVDGGTSAPSGQIFNATTDFMSDKFIVSTEDGTIAGWQTGTTATLRVNNSSANAVFKGLTVVPSTPQILLAADFHNGKIDVFDTTYAPVTPTAGKWVDPSVPTGYAPFNVAALGTSVYVIYALQDGEAHDDQAGAGHGALSVFDMTGTLVKSLVPAGGVLNSPWGIVQVPQGGWGALPAGALLVGDFGDGAINAFDPTSGKHLASFAKSAAAPLAIDGLWALSFGASPGDAGASQPLYFSAGPNGEANGLYGNVVPQ